MIWIVIPTYNRKNLTQECLKSLFQQTEKQFHVVVIDDGSNDGTSDMIRALYPKVTLLLGDGQLWWTGAINKGIRHVLKHCRGDNDVLVLNDDLIVPKDYIEKFNELSKSFPGTLIGSVVTDIHNRDLIYNGGIRIDWKVAKWKSLNTGKQLSAFSSNHYEEVSTLTGRGVLIPVEVFYEIGLYNDKHFLQCGDTELPRRANKHGYRLIMSYAVPVYSYIDDKGHINHLKKYRISDIVKYFGDIRSNQNLRYRFWFAFDSANNIFMGMCYFICDFIRITIHFIKKLKFN